MAHMINILHGLGLSVPGDVSLLGFDNLPLSALCSPRLTTIGQDIDRKAATVADMLVRHIQDKRLPPERVLLGVQLVERESVARIGR